MLNKENEATGDKIFSSDRKTFFKVIEHTDKSFSLEKYIVCYEPEEEVEYIVKQCPNPASRYQAREIAIEEAKRILG